MMQEILNIVRRETERVMARRALPRMGIVTSFDPDNYAAKVLIQPEGHETGWLPIHSPAAGNGSGMFFGPSPGDVVEVHYQEGGKGAPYIGLRQFGDRNRPMRVESGEFAVVHQSGAVIRIRNDGSVEIVAAGNLNITAPSVNITGDLAVDGDIFATGNIGDPP